MFKYSRKRDADLAIPRVRRHRRNSLPRCVGEQAQRDAVGANEISAPSLLPVERSGPELGVVSEKAAASTVVPSVEVLNGLRGHKRAFGWCPPSGRYSPPIVVDGHQEARKNGPAAAVEALVSCAWYP
jgi:hypothetical protein